jgi:hypothetical protein
LENTEGAWAYPPLYFKQIKKIHYFDLCSTFMSL